MTSEFTVPCVRRLPDLETLSASPLLALWCGLIDYDDAVEVMMSYHEQRRAGETKDVVLYLEHAPVITYGRATPAEHFAFVPQSVPLREVTRGGLATFHGPGQLVGYIIMNLHRASAPGLPDLHRFLRALEVGIANYLREDWELQAGTLTGKTGVWILDRAEPRKICSMGIAVRKWITYHGFALNITNDLTPFSYIVPCGLKGVTMTSIANELRLRSQVLEARSLREFAARLHLQLVDSLLRHGFHFDGENISDET